MDQDQLVLNRVPFSRQLSDLGEGTYIFNAPKNPDDQIHAIVDFETTGLDSEMDEIIEMGVFLFGVTESNETYPIAAGDWLNQPSKPISDEITSLTGITNEDLEGKKIPWGHVAALLENVTHFAAHNAAFDRKFFNRYMPDTRPWYCTSKGGDVQWSKFGFNTAGLELLTFKSGYFYDAHRAVVDCAAVFNLITLYPEVMQQVKESLATETYKIQAFAAPMRVKDDLKKRGYRWNPDAKVWWILVSGQEALEAEFMAIENMYFNARGSAKVELIPSNLKYLGE